MIGTDFTSKQVFIALGVTDMRKSINTLSVLVEDVLGGDLYSEALFVFCNRSRNIVKLLYWDKAGFCLWQKRLEQANFKWPKSEKEVLEISTRELEWLLNGLDIRHAHEKLTYTLTT